MTTIHTRQQQYTQDNYNTHKTTATIHTRQLQYTQDNCNNTHKTTATIHTRQLQQYTRSTNNNYTQDNLKLATKHTIQIGILITCNQYRGGINFISSFFFRFVMKTN